MTASRLVVLAASRGGLDAVSQVLAGLPAEFSAAVAVVLHRTSRPHDLLPDILARHTVLAVRLTTEGAAIEPGVVYVAPADSHVQITADRTFSLATGARFRYVGSSADPLMMSAAEVFGSDVVAVVLSGDGSDGAAGIATVRHAGGLVIVQDAADARATGMPLAAIATGAADAVLPLREIAPRLVRL